MNTNNNQRNNIRTMLLSIKEDNVMMRVELDNDRMLLRFVISKGQSPEGYYLFDEAHKEKDTYTLLTEEKQIALAEYIKNEIFLAFANDVETDVFSIALSAGDTNVSLATRRDDNGVMCLMVELGRKLTTQFPEKYSILIHPIESTITDVSGATRKYYVHAKAIAFYNRLSHPERTDNVADHAKRLRDMRVAMYYNNGNNNNNNSSYGNNMNNNRNNGFGAFNDIPSGSDEGLPFN